MDLRKAFIGVSMVAASLGFGGRVFGQQKPAMKDNVASASLRESISGPTNYIIPDYARLSNSAKDSLGEGVASRDYAHHQRYTYFNVNQIGKKNFDDDIKLQNMVTTAVIQQTVETVPGQKTEEEGGLYFAFGYNKFTPADVVKPQGFKSVDLDKIAAMLVKNPTFELKMTGHADRSGIGEQNQALSEHRIETGKQLLLLALQRQGLSAQDAKKLYDERVLLHTTILAEGDKHGPVTTAAGVKEQGNRVVTFDLITQTDARQNVKTQVNKGADLDNHEHTVVMYLGAGHKQDKTYFYPDAERAPPAGQYAIADENTNYVIKIAPERNGPFTIFHCVHSNLIADNTNFLIESDQPGAVTSVYNFENGAIDVRLNGRVMITINTLDRKIDPACIRIGQVTSDGHATISPLVNAAEVAPVSEGRHASADHNLLTDAADRIVHISIEAKHLFMAHSGDQAGYLLALSKSGFAGKLDDALQDLEKSGITTKTYKTLLLNSYSNPQSGYYSPDQIVFPFQTYQGLFESQLSKGTAKQVNSANAYNALLAQIGANAAPKPAQPPARSPAQASTP